MNKKIILAVIIISIIGGLSYFFYVEKGLNNKVGQISQAYAGKTNDFENLELFRIASEYLSGQPQLLLNGKIISDWHKMPGLEDVDLKWVTSHKAIIKYISPNKYKTTYNSYLNDKYLVNWFFIPGCEENPQSTNKPNWFNREGLPCLRGYVLSVLINPDGTVYRSELNALD